MLKSFALQIAIILPAALFFGVVGCTETDKRTGVTLSDAARNNKGVNSTTTGKVAEKTKDLDAYEVRNEDQIEKLLESAKVSGSGIEPHQIDGDYSLKMIVTDINLDREDDPFRLAMFHSIKDRRTMIDENISGKVIGLSTNKQGPKVVVNQTRFPDDEEDAKKAELTVTIPTQFDLDKEEREDGAMPKDFVSYSLKNESGEGFVYEADSVTNGTIADSNIFKALDSGSKVTGEEGFINGSIRETIGGHRYTVAIQRGGKKDIIITAVIDNPEAAAEDYVRKTVKLVYSGKRYKPKRNKPRNNNRNRNRDRDRDGDKDDELDD